MWVKYNANPTANRVGDCVIRAISKATRQEWEKTYMEICCEGLMLHDMPSSNNVWGNYLKGLGYCRFLADEGETVKDFAENHPQGEYILAISGHAVACVEGSYYDTWDSGDEIVLYYWERKCK